MRFSGSAQATWNLVWSDEFNGTAGSAPDSNKWRYDVGGGGWGNNEEEVYCAFGSNATPCSTATPNAYIDGNGNLIIQAVNLNGTWTSARMNTYQIEPMQYGRIEARMKLPIGTGIWPAFWMLGANFNTAVWPLCGEMDIMEWVPQYGPSKTSSTIHGPFSGGNGVGSAFTFPNGGRVDDANYHTYGVIWSPNQAQFYRDDPTTPYFTIAKNTDIPGDWVFNHPFFVIMNLAMGGYFPDYTDSTTPNPSVMTVDYVRVYRGSNLVSGPVSINAGGDSEGSFFADTNFSGGNVTSTTATIDTSLIPAPVPPQAVYQTAREGVSKYTITGLVPDATYKVTLHFAETQWSGPGERRFNVSINNKPVLTNFDIFASAGAKNKAIEESFTVAADPLSGGIVVGLTAGSTGQPTISGIVVTQTADNESTSGRVSIDTGAGDVGNFMADTDYSGGNSATTFSAIDTSLVSAPVPPQAVFQSERWAPSTYTIGGFVPGTSHTVTLYFAEIYWTQPGQRQFNVLINGNQVLTNFDIVGATGAKNKAIEELFPATANAQGQIIVQFTAGAADQPKISGIVVN